MAQIDIRTTPISLQTFKSITDSNGLFKTWADIIKEAMDSLVYSGEIMNTNIKAPDEVIGNNIFFSNTSNANVVPFNDNTTKWNNKLTEDKSIMILYSEYMLPLEIDLTDKHSALEWSRIISEKWNSLYVAKKDLENMLAIDEIMKVAIALGNVAVIEGADQLNLNYDENKKLGLLLAEDRIKNRTKRTKYMKGYSKEIERFLTSPALSLNLLSGLTASSAAPQAYEDTKTKFQIQNVFGHNYEMTPMYLGQNISMSEYTPDEMREVKNTGIMTGQIIKDFQFENLVGLMFANESIGYYTQTYGERTVPAANSRFTEVTTFAYKTNVGIKPFFAGMNKAYVSKVPVLKSYTKLNGEVVAEKNLSTAAGFNALINELYTSQPQLYNKFGWTGSSNLQQGDVDKIWKQKIEWKTPTAKSK